MGTLGSSRQANHQTEGSSQTVAHFGIIVDLQSVPLSMGARHDAPTWLVLYPHMWLPGTSFQNEASERMYQQSSQNARFPLVTEDICIWLRTCWAYVSIRIGIVNKRRLVIVTCTSCCAGIQQVAKWCFGFMAYYGMVQHWAQAYGFCCTENCHASLCISVCLHVLGRFDHRTETQFLNRKEQAQLLVLSVMSLSSSS